MDKISGILPNNPRVSSVDMASSQPVRPGAPTFGQKEGFSSIKDRVSIGENRSGEFNPVGNYSNSKEAVKAKIAEDVSRRFFATKNLPMVSSEEEPVTEVVGGVSKSLESKTIEPQPSESQESFN